MRIDIDQIVGTRSETRQKAFSASFYPLLEESSEFAAKWSALAASHLKEGIRDPIIAIEYLNRYYVVEGHKRVSVLRYFGAVSLPAEVRRVIPPRSEEPKIIAYYEFLDFYRLTKTNYLCFDRPGEYPALTQLLCGDNRETWNEDRQRSLMSDVTRFRKAFRTSPLFGKMTQDEALLGYLKVFGYAHLQGRTPTELKADLAAVGSELLSIESNTAPALMADPTEQPRDLLTWITHLPTRTLKAAFLHDGDVDSSAWTRSHELGRQYLQQIFGDRVQTQSCFHMNAENFLATAQALAQDGVQVIFSTSPKLQAPTLTAAGALPEVKFLNCSLDVSHPIMRCYYGRMYEANFLTGVVAGAMSPDGQIPYIIRYPVYSTLASINAFALGARMVNPRALILLQDSQQPETELSSLRTYTGVAVISGKDSEGHRGVAGAQRKAGGYDLVLLGLGRTLPPDPRVCAGRLVGQPEQDQRSRTGHQLLVGPLRQRGRGKVRTRASRQPEAPGDAAARADRTGFAEALRRAGLRPARSAAHRP